MRDVQCLRHLLLRQGRGGLRPDCPEAATEARTIAFVSIPIRRIG
jgi:hypothetical protein